MEPNRKLIGKTIAFLYIAKGPIRSCSESSEYLIKLMRTMQDPEEQIIKHYRTDRAMACSWVRRPNMTEMSVFPKITP